jgi:1-acyl-sn-glycerol-3-phosphate acyltransferase
MLDRAYFQSYRAIPSAGWHRSFGFVWELIERVSRTQIRFEGLDALSGGPVLIATNSTQKYDFLPLRAILHRHRMPVVTLTKGKNYHQPVMAFLLERLGVVPIASRGYLLMVDFVSTLGRRPSEGEYRAIRDHLDHALPLPEGESGRRLQSTPRLLLGHRFDPNLERYRDLIRRIYSETMAHTLRLTRTAVEGGHHVQMYPEGTVSSRLGEGRIGAVQLAWALGLPIVPVGLNGCRGAFLGAAPLLRGGAISIRFGRPYRLPGDLLPPDFIAFDAQHEARHRLALRAATDELMSRLDALLDPELQRREGFAPDGTQGTRRFL